MVLMKSALRAKLKKSTRKVMAVDAVRVSLTGEAGIVAG